MPVPIKPMLSDWIERARAMPERPHACQELFRERFGNGLKCRPNRNPGGHGDMDSGAFYRMYEGIEKDNQQRRQSEALHSRVQPSPQPFFGGQRENVPSCAPDSRKPQPKAFSHEPSIAMTSIPAATIADRDLNSMWERELRQRMNGVAERLPFQSIGNVQQQGGGGVPQGSIHGVVPGSRTSKVENRALQAEKALPNGCAINGLQHAEFTPANATGGIHSVQANIVQNTCEAAQTHAQHQFQPYTAHQMQGIVQQQTSNPTGEPVGIEQLVTGIQSQQKPVVDDATTKLVLDAMMNQQQLIQAGLQACLQNTLTVQSHQNNMVAAILQTVAQNQATSAAPSPPNQLQALLQSVGAMAVQRAVNSALGGLQQCTMASNGLDQDLTRPRALDGLDDIPICYDFVQGKCSRRNCRYSHDTDRIIRHNSKEKGICFDHLRGECKRGAMCRFSHNLKDIVRRSYNDKSDICQDTASVLSGLSCQNEGRKWGKGICYDFVRGACGRGQNCPWSHDLMEIAVVTKRDSHPLGPAERAQIMFSTWGNMAESVDLGMDEPTQSSDCPNGVNETTDDTEHESEPHECQTVADDDSQLSIQNDEGISTIENRDRPDQTQNPLLSVE